LAVHPNIWQTIKNHHGHEMTFNRANQKKHRHDQIYFAFFEKIILCLNNITKLHEDLCNHFAASRHYHPHQISIHLGGTGLSAVLCPEPFRESLTGGK